MILFRIVCAFKMFWFGLWRYDILPEKTLTFMSDLFRFILKCVNDNKPYSTHLYIDDHRIASLWVYPGLSKNPIDRIAELLEEVDSLKEALNQKIINEEREKGK